MNNTKHKYLYVVTTGYVYVHIRLTSVDKTKTRFSALENER